MDFLNLRASAFWAVLCAMILMPLSTARPSIPYTDEAPMAAGLTARLVQKFQEIPQGERTRFSVFVQDARSGEIYVEINANRSMVPASLVKLYTSAAALDILGPDHRFDTYLVADGDINDGVLFGSLIIKGGGDPSLGPRFQQDPSDMTFLLREWTEAIRAAGIREIQGDIIGDDSRYPFEPHGTGWERTEIGEWYSAEVSALNFNDNCVDILWRPGSSSGRRPNFSLIPDTGYVAFSNGVRQVNQIREPEIRYFRFPGSNEIVARGRIPLREQRYGYMAVHDPAAFTAFLLKEQLNSRGVRVNGGAIAGRFLRMETAMDSAHILHHQQSPPLTRILPVVNGISQNLYAEVLLREIALAKGEEATFAGGARALTDWLEDRNIRRSGDVVVDGSGLSPVNRTTARSLGELLRQMHRHPQRGVFRASLAQPGQRGSLNNRFEREQYQALRGSVQAKTGYLTSSQGLAGYMNHPSGRELVFVIMVNDYDVWRGRLTMRFIEEATLLIHQARL